MRLIIFSILSVATLVLLAYVFGNYIAAMEMKKHYEKFEELKENLNELNAELENIESIITELKQYDESFDSIIKSLRSLKYDMEDIKQNKLIEYKNKISYLEDKIKELKEMIQNVTELIENRPVKITYITYMGGTVS